MQMNAKKIGLALLFITLILIAFFLGTVMQALKSAFSDNVVYELEKMVLVSRSPDWKYEEGFYAAVVTLKKEGDFFNVECKVHIGNENYYEHISLGKVSTEKEAYARWGKIQWTNDSLIIGTKESKQVIVKRSKIVRHR
jgi:hypothetical protein